MRKRLRKKKQTKKQTDLEILRKKNQDKHRGEGLVLGSDGFGFHLVLVNTCIDQ